jgi:hypothetical protein
MASIRKIAGAVALFFLLCGIGHAADAPVAGEILTTKGDSFVEREGRREPLPAGAEIHVGDIVEVSNGARLKLRMIDGTVLSAGSGSRLKIDSYDSDGVHRDVKLDLATGILRAVVTKMTGTVRYEIDTATGVAAVRGTDWFLVATKHSTQVGVIDGFVELSSKATHHAVQVACFLGSRVDAGQDPAPPRIWRQVEFDAVMDRTDLN